MNPAQSNRNRLITIEDTLEIRLPPERLRYPLRLHRKTNDPDPNSWFLDQQKRYGPANKNKKRFGFVKKITKP